MGFLSSVFGKKPEAGRGIDELGRRLGMDLAALKGVAATYKEMRIPKRDGSPRVLHVPEAGLMELQRRLLRKVLARLKAHPSATGFERGHSIVTNALPHLGAAVIVRMDVRDFFPSTTATRIRQYFVDIGWGGEAADLLTSLTTHRGALPQGAPTSPRLSNLVNCRLDARLAAMAAKLGAAYTRYADDLTFSFAEDRREAVGGVIVHTKSLLEEYGYRLHTQKKLRIARQCDRMLVTGLVTNQVLNLPRKTRRRLRAVEHHLRVGREATLTAQQLHGWRALEAMIAPFRAGGTAA